MGSNFHPHVVSSVSVPVLSSVHQQFTLKLCFSEAVIVASVKPCLVFVLEHHQALFVVW